MPLKVYSRNPSQKIEKLQKETDNDPYQPVVDWFFEESNFELLDEINDEAYKNMLDKITPLDALVKKYQKDTDPKDMYFIKEFVLWGLVEYKKLSKYRLSEGFRFNDLYGSYISGL